MRLRPVVSASGWLNAGCDHRCACCWPGQHPPQGSASKPFHLWQIIVRPSSSQRTFQKQVLPEKIARRPPRRRRTRRSPRAAAPTSIRCGPDQHARRQQRLQRRGIDVQVVVGEIVECSSGRFRPGDKQVLPFVQVARPSRRRGLWAWARDQARSATTQLGCSSKPRLRRLTSRGADRQARAASSSGGNGRWVESTPRRPRAHRLRQPQLAPHQRADVAIGRCARPSAVVGVPGVGGQRQQPGAKPGAPARRLDADEVVRSLRRRRR